MSKVNFGNIEEAKRVLQSRVPNFPKFVIVLGSGLSSLLDSLQMEKEISYTEIPHWRQATVQGHAGKLLIGALGGVRVAVMKGRLHFYEGYPMQDVVFPYRVLALCGAEVFFLTNASGGMRATMKPCDLVLIKDHINLFGTNPLVGANEERLGPRFPDMTRLYDPELRKILLKQAKKLKVKLTEGVYVGLHGPSFETPAEIKFFKTIGGDVVGMSTAPEAIALHHMGKRVVGVSFVTNLAAGVGKTLLNHEEVLENAKKGHKKFAELVIRSLEEMDKL